jgi:hypothetical protein
MNDGVSNATEDLDFLPFVRGAGELCCQHLTDVIPRSIDVVLAFEVPDGEPEILTAQEAAELHQREPDEGIDSHEQGLPQQRNQPAFGPSGGIRREELLKRRAVGKHSDPSRLMLGTVIFVGPLV